MSDSTTNLPVKRCTKCDEEKPISAFGVARRCKDGLCSHCKTCRGTVNPRVSPVPAPEGMKCCTKCAQIKLFVFFSKGSGKDGYSYWCKGCERAYRDANLEQHNANNRAWRRANIERMSELERGYRNSEKRKAQIQHWRKVNERHLREYDRNRHQKNPQIKRARTRAWMKANPIKTRINSHNRAAREKAIGGYFTVKDFSNMQHIQGGKCAYCGRLNQALTIDHIIPTTRKASSNDPWNLALCCQTCNSSKNDRTLEEWIVAGRWFDGLDGFI